MPKDKMDLSRDDFLAAVDALAATDTGTDRQTPAPPTKPKERALAALYGERIKHARQWKGFTIDEVAIKTGIDRGVLEAAENGETILPLGWLTSVVKTLSLRLADVITRGQEPFTVVRANERKSFDRYSDEETGDHGYRYESLAPKKKGKTMEPFVVTLYPSKHLEPSSHEGQEFLYVLEGEIVVELKGSEKILGPGDAIFYDSLDTHLVRAHGETPARIVAVLSS